MITILTIVMTGWRGWGEEQILLTFARLPNDIYPYSSNDRMEEVV
jgi:hypothetical protein